jgi:hypothetical protein
MEKKKTGSPYLITAEECVPPEKNPEVQAIIQAAEKELKKESSRKEANSLWRANVSATTNDSIEYFIKRVFNK